MALNYAYKPQAFVDRARDKVTWSISEVYRDGFNQSGHFPNPNDLIVTTGNTPRTGKRFCMTDRVVSVDYDRLVYTVEEVELKEFDQQPIPDFQTPTT
jgi:hypothetical protein